MVLYQLSYVRGWLSLTRSGSYLASGALSRPGDVLNSSGFLGQYKNAFVQRAALLARPGRSTVPGHRLTDVHDFAPMARFGGLIATDLRDVTSDPAALDSAGWWAVTASPELFLRRDDRTVESGPIKGTGRTAADLSAKDRAENVMIVDLVRNDLGRVCATGSVTVPALCAVEEHPGLVHLVSTVRGELAETHEKTAWADLLGATFPPGSVTGAPKSSALRIIDELETAPRGPYCGGIGWVDADRRTGWLNVGIRTFWIDRAAPAGPALRFGAGAGIIWDSDPDREWAETELKARRLLAVASGEHEVSGGLKR